MLNWIIGLLVVVDGLYLIGLIYVNLEVARKVLPVARQTKELLPEDRITVLLCAFRITERLCIDWRIILFLYGFVLYGMYAFGCSGFLLATLSLTLMARFFLLWFSMNHFEIVLNQTRKLTENEADEMRKTLASPNWGEIW